MIVVMDNLELNFFLLILVLMVVDDLLVIDYDPILSINVILFVLLIRLRLILRYLYG